MPTRWVQLNTTTTRAEVKHHSEIGVGGNGLLEQSGHLGRNNTVDVCSSVLSLHFEHILRLSLILSIVTSRSRALQ
jgi:hypothetical protein